MFIVNSYQFWGVAPPSIDPDAQAFLTAAAITDPTITSAIDTLVVQLKADGIFTKMKAIYPFVGGTATTHKYNLKNPLDTDAAFRLVFSGGWTHSANGATPNGTNAFADTFFNPSTDFVIGSTHLSYYSRTNVASVGTTKIDIGQANFATNKRLFLTLRDAFNNVAYSSGTFGSRVQITNLISSGFFIGSRTSTSAISVYKNGISLQSNTILDSTVLDVFTIYLGAINNSGAAGFFSSRQSAFASVGEGLTNTEAGNYNTAVQNFNTTLARQV